ncbi:multidrug efflux RND transporter permease subunit [Polyangium sp. y55x31]|uniref:multidrug efflux RND transporter permease subunit n=1 Tax=Polyangium sp. y55x31 TaxID=3042688 RepID=UPI002482D8A5|nr:multidrug efflux RND transporter permease subunit [Polyangium sp. y55x31]MDI1480444.1 multidrug efflux RND transporter permease subunit [Polyangium sp. y55x31]
MPRFFIERPVFAWVVSLFIVLLGVLALGRLPVERYPTVAPPSVNVTAVYPGATPSTMSESVLAPIEREISGVPHLLYFESSSDTSGVAQITVTFEPGTDPELAQVAVQNRLRTVEPRLPQMVRQIGLAVEASTSNFLCIVDLRSPDGRYDEQTLGDFLSRGLVEELKRVRGVGSVQVFAAARALRVWLDPAQLAALEVSVEEVANAIRAQNAQVSPGRVGDAPTVPGQRVTIPLVVKGELETPEEFGAIVLRARPDGSRVLLSDVARIELGAQSYRTSTRTDGSPSAGAGVMLSPGANAVETAALIRARVAELAEGFPDGIEVGIPYDTAPFVRISIEKVFKTFFEAMALVFVVMFVFLQNLRYTLVPAIVAPIALLGTFAVMYATGYSINVLTMFGMVLAIGIIVDDAIVVVENVERIMATERLSPKDATKKAMKEITGAVIGITLVLSAVFIPMAFASGSVGTIYRQFSLSMAVSILLSAFLALSLTPALCATLLKPVPAHHDANRGVFGPFNRGFAWLTERYGRGVGRVVKRSWIGLVSLVAIGAGAAWLFRALPGSFLPQEDQGYWISSVALPSDATAERTDQVIRSYEAYVRERPGVRAVVAIQGFGFSGSGPNAALMFTILKDWDAREGATAQGEVQAANERFSSLRDGMMFNVLPPSIDSLGTSAGFAMRLVDRRNQGQARLLAARNQLLAAAAKSRVVQGVYPEGLPDGASVRVEIDRQSAEAFGVSFASINATLSAALGSMYVNDFPNAGRLQQVILQAEPGVRMQLDDVFALPVRNQEGRMVPLSAVATPRWERSPLQLVRYNGYPAMRLSGTAASGFSSGEAMAEMERLVAQLPPGYGVEWTGLSYQERLSGDEAPALIALSLLVVFLVLAALYESWSIPVSVMLVVPLGLLGALLAVKLRGMPNDVFFKVGLITLIGLSAKNAILIVEFAKQLEEEGRSAASAAIEAARLRLRPILMTSLAFTLGVVPLAIASGASAETQRALGTGVLGGMISATVLALVLVPAFYVVVRSVVKRLSPEAAGRRPEAAPSIQPTE